VEFDIIAKYFNWQQNDTTILKSIGDDAAVIQNTNKLIISTDTLIENVHFFAGTKASDIAYKALMVNLSDIAAMGAKPKYFTLNLSLEQIDNNWLKEFANELQNIAKKYNISLIGGDTTQGPLTISITIIGECNKPLLRSGAKIGDGVFISGNLGGAKLALEQIKNNNKVDALALNKLKRPQAQVALGLELSGIATSCIDISDGLAQDLNHILVASNVGVDIWSNSIPIFEASTLNYALFGGDDYELCFTASVDNVAHINNITQIGVVNNNKILTLDGKKLPISGYKHF
jgi:thiamine-monophosphate kinase